MQVQFSLYWVREFLHEYKCDCKIMSSLRSPVSRGSSKKAKVRRRVPLPRLDLAEGNYHALEGARSRSAAKFTSGIIYGLVNAILTIPCMYGYAAIIFSHPSFGPYRPQLSKLVLL